MICVNDKQVSSYYTPPLLLEGGIMNRILALCCLSLTAVPGVALAQETIPVSGSFDYTPEIFTKVPGGDSVFFDASEDEVWTGDIEGTAVSPFRMVVTPDGGWDAWLYSEFKGTVGAHEGTMRIVSRYKRPAQDAHWAGEWIILSGTGELEHVQGHGSAWGPGFNAKDPEAGPDIYYSGEVIFPPE
jgi:Protein of unknown function (DUF3224)